MAEIGLVASVIQIADTGIKLSITLYTFAETVLTADKSIKEIASDVSLTSSVLEELGQNLKKDQKSRLCSDNAVRTAEGIVKECGIIFKQINETLQTTLNKIKPPAGGGKGKGKGKDGAQGGRTMAVAALERLKWPFLQPKMQLLRSNLDRLKSTLVLMLNVITYARKVAEDHAPPSTLEDQRKLIEDLARSNQEYTRKFTELNKAVEASNVKQEGVKDLSALENDIPPGIFQTNIAIPPSDSVSLANKTSEAHDNRHTIRLAIQGIPRDAGATSEELAHYCFLINHLLERIDAVQYKIRRDVRRRIRNDVMHMHQREADNLQELHGQLKFSMAMKTAKIWPQSPSPVEFRASQSSEGFAARTLLRKNVKSLQLKDGRSDGEGLVDDDGSLLHCNSIQATEAEMDEMTKRMKQLAERPAEDITKEYKGKDSALSNADLSRTRRSRPHIGTPSNDFEAENLPAQVNEDMVIIEPKSNVQQNLLNKKTEAKLDPVEGGGRRSHRKGSSLQSSTLDRERAENRYLLSEHTRVAAINRGGSYSVESTTSLVKHLEILDAFALIRDDILKIGDVKPLIGRFKRGGSTTENAEDAIATAHILWIYMMALYTNVHVHQDDGLSSIFEVARLAKLLLDSARIKVQDWNGRVAIEKRINSILDKTEADGPAARKDILRVASRKFNLLYSSQRSRLRRMWHQQTPSDLQDVKVKHATSRSPARGISSPDSALRTPSRRGRSLAARDSTLPNEPYASPTSVKRENITPRSSDDGPFYPPPPPPILVLPEASPKHERRQNQAQSLSPYRQQQRRSSLFERTERWADSDSDDPTPHDPHHAAHRTASRRRWSNGSWGSHCASDEAPASGSADLEEEGFANFRGDEESPAFRCLDDDDDSEGGTHSVGSGEMAGRYGNAKECSVADRIEYKDEDGNRNGDGDIVDDLLAQWTTLPHMR